MRSVIAWLRWCCKCLRVPAVGPGWSRMSGTDQSPSTLCCQVFSAGDVVVRRQDTARTRVQVMEPLVGDARVAQVFDSRNLLPSSFGEEWFFRRLSGVLSFNRESCAWSYAVPSRLFQGAEKSMSSHSWLGCSRADTVGFLTLGCIVDIRWFVAMPLLLPGPPSERTASPWLRPRHRERQGRWRGLFQ